MEIRTVTVVGANGTMGCNVAGMFASFGGARVYMVSRDVAAGEAAKKRAALSVRAGAVSERLEPVGFDRLGECVAESDLVFESVSENMAAKVDVWCRVAEHLRPGTLACTGTSGLSIGALSAVLPEASRPYFMGVHFFNPPYAMRLCELCPTALADERLIGDVRAYLEGKLRRIVVEVSDAPAFLANRIGFELINRAMQVAEEERSCGGIDYVDSLLGPFTGRAMAPLATADFVGLDVHKAIVDNVFSHAVSDPAHGAFALPAFCRHLVGEGRLGRKAGGMGGLYRMERDGDGARRLMVHEIGTSGGYRPARVYDMPFADKMVGSLRVGDYAGAISALADDDSREAALCRRFLAEYVAYSLWAAREVSGDVRAADDVMAAGFNWCPPLALAGAISLVRDLRGFVEESLDQKMLDTLGVGATLSDVPPSRYDFRRYFRAAR